jgi:hypothetical protein
LVSPSSKLGTVRDREGRGGHPGIAVLGEPGKAERRIDVWKWVGNGKGRTRVLENADGGATTSCVASGEKRYKKSWILLNWES